MLHFINDENVSIVSIDETNGTNPVLQDLYENNRTNFDSPNLITRLIHGQSCELIDLQQSARLPLEKPGILPLESRPQSRDIPVVEVRRASIWEDYNNSDANATAKVDGVNTASPVTAEEFLVHRYSTGDTIIPDLKYGAQEEVIG